MTDVVTVRMATKRNPRFDMDRKALTKEFDCTACVVELGDEVEMVAEFPDP